MYLPSSIKCLRSVYIGVVAILIASLVACGGGSSSSSSSSTAGPTAFYAVTNTNDSGAGSLREAITSVNASSSSQYSGIYFSVAGVITLASDLPAMLPVIPLLHHWLRLTLIISLQDLISIAARMVLLFMLYLFMAQTQTELH